MSEGRRTVTLWRVWFRFLAVGAALTALSCGGEDVIAPSTGSLEITTATSGPEPDGDGYSVAIDDGPETDIGANAILRRDNLEPGNHTVRLAGVASNCAVEGANPRTVEVPAGATTPVSLTIHCGASSGSLEVTTSTVGGSPDADGYAWALDAVDPRQIGINETVLVGNLAMGSHIVTLSNLASNCRIEGNNPRTVSVIADATTRTTFSISCLATQGTKILFRSTRDGVTDLFVMNTDGSAPMNLTSRARQQGQWSPGDFQWSHDGQRIAFVASGPVAVSDAEPIPTRIVVMNADGSNITNLIDDPSIPLKAGPQWSPDNRRIAFYSDRDGKIYVTNVDGSGSALLGAGRGPVWSPDGTRIAFERDRRIFVMKADGSGETDLGSDASNDYSVTWSPDGSKIAFVRDGGSGPSPFTNLWCMNADGSDPKNLTHLPLDYPYVAFYGYSWAPDGSKLALSATGSFHELNIYVVRADGTGLTAIIGSFRDQYFSPRWSPDGARILFSARELWTIANDLFVMNADGSGLTPLTNLAGDQEDPAEDELGEWQP
jgi:Tol biopolymer transport system component